MSTLAMRQLILPLLFAVSLSACDQTPKAAPQTKQPTQKADPRLYPELRNRALQVKPEQLHLELASDTSVYGVVMDWNLGDATATLVAIQGGDASLYLSSGGGVIGGIQHPNVVAAANKLVALAQPYLGKTKTATGTALPQEGGIRFFLLTRRGLFMAEDHIRNFDNESSSWLPLFIEGNNVITELRKVGEMH